MNARKVLNGVLVLIMVLAMLPVSNPSAARAAPRPVQGMKVTESASIPDWNITAANADGVVTSTATNDMAATNLVVPDNYATIQAAIDAAGTGDTIYVRAGIYSEHLTISKAITLTGENRATTIIDGGGSGDGMYITADLVNISGFTVRNGVQGIHLYGADNCRIDNVLAASNSDSGIFLQASTYNTVTNSVVTSNQYGINTGDQGSEHNTFQNITAYSNTAYGIIGYASSNDTKILNSVIHDSGRGVAIGWSQNWSIENTAIYSTGTGIYIDTGDYATVKNCDIYSNTQGVRFTGFSANHHTFVGNRFYANTESGLCFSNDAHYNTISDNDFYNNHWGVYIPDFPSRQSADNTFHHNTFVGNAVNALVAPSSTNTWDNGAQGNYWSDYTGVDANHDGIGDTSYVITSTTNVDRYPLIYTSMVNILLLAADTSGNLPTQYEPLYQQLRQSAQADPAKTIVGLFDLAGPSDTHIIVFQGATETLITGLPDATGTLSATLREYNMTASADLGGFLKWALATYAPGDVPVAVHYIGHGNFLAPVLDDLSQVFPNLTRSAATAANFIPPLPSRIDSNPTLTDEHPRALFAPQAFADALNFATGGQRRIAVLDLVHCYAGALEELYSLSPYADWLLASPFYTYWSPEMTGAALTALHSAQSPQQMADAILSAYHTTLLAADDPATTWNDHPHLLIALDPAGMDNLKNAWDHVSDYLLQAAVAPSTRARLLAAYQAAPVYDTTFCNGDFACAAPDALADFVPFAEAVADQFQDNLSVALWASVAAQQADSMITARYAANGQPWFAAPQPPSWNFDNARGLAIFAPFVTNDVTVGGVTHHYLPWQIRWYTEATNGGENPNPLRWAIDTRWDEVIESYWSGASVETEACLPALPGVLQSGEVSAVRITAPVIGTVTLDTPARPKGVIRAGEALAGVQVRFTIQQGAQPVYTNTVAAGYLPAGAQVEVSASQDWSPVVIGPYTLTLTVDPNDQIMETNEGDNTVTRSDQVLPPGQPRPIVTATVSAESQMVVSNTVALNMQSSQSPATLFIQVYQYPATLSPTMQVVSPIPVYLKTFTRVTLPLNAWPFTIPAATLHPGPVVLHVWGVTSNGPSVFPAIVTFNYAPPAASLSAGAAHYFLLNLNQDDTVHFDLTATSGDPNLFGWRPDNYGAPNWQGTAVGSDSLDIALAPFTGQYLFEVYGQTAGSYTLAFTRNSVPGLRQTASTVDPNPAAYIPTARPYLLAPIPEMPRPSRYLTYLPRIAR